MGSPKTSKQTAPLSAAYVAEGTYPADICVLRYALERNARDRPDRIFAAFEGGERWTFAQTLVLVQSPWTTGAGPAGFRLNSPFPARPGRGDPEAR